MDPGHVRSGQLSQGRILEVLIYFYFFSLAATKPAGGGWSAADQILFRVAPTPPGGVCSTWSRGGFLFGEGLNRDQVL